MVAVVSYRYETIRCAQKKSWLLFRSDSPGSLRLDNLIRPRFCGRPDRRETAARMTRAEAQQDIFEYVEVFYNRLWRNNLHRKRQSARPRTPADESRLTTSTRNRGKIIPRPVAWT